ncbi:hypothetical protein GQ53DRAFT_846122 [Thozetella sp. PMI_491]|nr:hypothetical protein GQ53DRAFT_846122 [Thozetella sp. PMI_491]
MTLLSPADDMAWPWGQRDDMSRLSSSTIAVFNQMGINHDELLARLWTNAITQQEYFLAMQTHNDRIKLCVNSATEVTPLQEAAVKDLVLLVKNLHDPSTSASTTVEKEELDGFINLIFENGWTSMTPVDAPDLAPPALMNPMDLAVEFGEIVVETLLYDMDENAEANASPLTASHATQFTTTVLRERQAGDHIFLRARLEHTETASSSALDFSYFDQQLRFIRWSGRTCRLLDNWSQQKAMREALRLWDQDQWTRLSSHNLAWAIFYARLRFAHWSWGDPVGSHQWEDPGVYRALRLVRNNTQGVNQTVTAALAAHKRTTVPPFLPDRAFTLDEAE